MRNRWYADNRDLVKWGILVHLAAAYDVEAILQVAYFREDAWEDIEIDGQSHPLPSRVVDHFRSIHNVRDLLKSTEVVVLDSVYADRRKYLRYVLEQIRANSSKRKIVFLDPDTGLEPKSRPSLNHVLAGELRSVWEELEGGDVLVFYQHANRNQGWLSERRGQFEETLGLVPGQGKVARGSKIASDVAFFYCVRQ